MRSKWIVPSSGTSKAIVAAVVAGMLFAVVAGPAGVAGARTGGVDGDGDKIFDSLDRRLARASAGEKVGVIAVFDGGSSSDRAAEARDAVGDFETGYEYETIAAFSAEMSPGQVRALALRPGVVQIQEDSAVELAVGTAKEAAGADRAALDFSVDGNNEASTQCPGIRQYCKDDVVIAVLDSGIDTAHVDLDAGKVIGGADCSTGTCSGGSWMVDTNGHGTHVASIAAGEGDGNPAMKGVAPGAALVSVKVGSSGSTVSALDASLEWVLANKQTLGIEIVNMSLNGKTASDGTDTTSRLVNRLAAAGITTFSAMGNGAPDPGTVSFPAAAKYGLGVGNMADPVGGGPSGYGFSLWWMSKRGPTADGRIKPDLLGYGVDIVAADANTGSAYESMSGTSQATPFAAGVAALMLDANPSLVPSGTACAAGDVLADCADGVVDSSMSVPVKDLMTQSAVDWAKPGLDNETGAGRLDAYAAVDAASALVGSNVAPPTHTFIEGSLASGGSAGHTFAVTDASIPIAATVVMADRPAGVATPDFNLELLGPGGERLAYSASEANFRQETVSARPAATGTYTVCVVSASGEGVYWIDLSYGGAAAPAPTPTPSPAPTPTPTPAPPAPSDLTAAAVTGSTSQIDLRWTDVAGETGYIVERSADGVSGWTQVATTAAGIVTYRDSGLSAGTTYYYRVKAYGDGGESAFSNTASARTNSGDTTAPTTPTSLKASGGRGKISLTWRASTDSGGSGLAGYKVFRSTTSTGTFTQIGTSTTTSYADPVAKGITYWYYVVAYDKAGNNSAPSLKVSAKAT